MHFSLSPPGTHWVAEILHMLTTGSTEYSGRTKEFAMLEYCDDLQMLETLKPPRLLNSHLFMAQLPKEIVEKKVKVREIMFSITASSPRPFTTVSHSLCPFTPPPPPHPPRVSPSLFLTDILSVGIPVTLYGCLSYSVCLKLYSSVEAIK